MFFQTKQSPPFLPFRSVYRQRTKAFSYDAIIQNRLVEHVRYRNTQKVKHIFTKAYCEHVKGVDEIEALKYSS